MDGNRWLDQINILHALFEAMDHASDARSLRQALHTHLEVLAPGTAAFCIWSFHDAENDPETIESEHFSRYLPTPPEISYLQILRTKFGSGTSFIYRSSLKSSQKNIPLRPSMDAGAACDLLLPVIRSGKVAGILYLLGKKTECYPEKVRGLLSLAFHCFVRKHHILSPVSETSKKPDIRDEDHIIQKIIDTDPNYIFVKDENSNFVLVNQAVANLFETTKEDIVQQGLPFIKKHRVNIVLDRSTDRKVLENGETVESEEAMSLASGETRWVRTTKIPLVLKSGKVLVLGISVDITPIRMQTKTLEEAKALKEQFLANISHELRTPINGIVGMIKMLETTPTLPEQKKYLEAIRKSSETLQVLIRDILDFSVIESGNIRFNKIGFKPRPLLTALVESFRYEARQKGLQLTLNYDPYVDQVLIGDPIRLNQILLNVLSNAMKFTQKGYVRVYVLRQNEGKETAHLKFLVEDSGIGINKKDQSKIFELFEQANDKISKKYGGTGLGLSIVRQLVELQNGKIDVESNAGKGTRFTIELEFKVGSEEDLELQSDNATYLQSARSIRELQSCRILVVEDNEVNLLYSKMLLEKWNCNVDSATNGVEALEMLQANDYDVILMDMLMPVMDGEEATQYIRSQLASPKSETCIIAITANALAHDIRRYRGLGVDDCLTKPYKPEDLRAVILKNLHGKDSSLQKEEAIREPVTNLEYLRKLSNNDDSFLREMVRSFRNESPKDVETMHMAADKNNWQQVRDLAHKLKPSLTFMGMNSTYGILEDIREAAISEDVEKLQKLIASLELKVTRAVEELNRRFPS